MTLSELQADRAAIVVRVLEAEHQSDWARQLAEIGFTPGEPVRVLRRAALGGDPLVVRVGSGTFALRLAEAACVQVHPIDG
jgi:ferrous iron transport protein A